MAVPKHINSKYSAIIIEDSDGAIRARTSSKTSGLSTAGRITSVDVSDSVWTSIPEIPLENRNAIAIQNDSGVDVKINYSNTADTSLGINISNGCERFYDITDSIDLFAISSSGTATLIIEEIS